MNLHVLTTWVLMKTGTYLQRRAVVLGIRCDNAVHPRYQTEQQSFSNIHKRNHVLRSMCPSCLEIVTHPAFLFHVNIVSITMGKNPQNETREKGDTQACWRKLFWEGTPFTHANKSYRGNYITWWQVCTRALCTVDKQDSCNHANPSLENSY